jgi:tetratricopeptide (TPR) repeat protein
VKRALHYLLLGRDANPNLEHLYSAIGEIYYLQGRQESDFGRDPVPLFSLAEEEYQNGIDISPKYANLHLNFAWLSYLRGKLRVRSGADAGGHLREAIRHAEDALILRKHPGATLCIGSAYRMKAEHEYNQGRDPSVDLKRARSLFASLLEDNPDSVPAHRALARAWTLEARSLMHINQDPSTAFMNAEKQIEAALSINPGATGVHLANARRCVYQATWLREQGKKASSVIECGIESSERALEIRPGLPEAITLRASLISLRDVASHPLGTDR